MRCAAALLVGVRTVCASAPRRAAARVTGLARAAQARGVRALARAHPPRRRFTRCCGRHLERSRHSCDALPRWSHHPPHGAARPFRATPRQPKRRHRRGSRLRRRRRVRAPGHDRVRRRPHGDVPRRRRRARRGRILAPDVLAQRSVTARHREGALARRGAPTDPPRRPRRLRRRGGDAARPPDARPPRLPRRVSPGRLALHVSLLPRRQPVPPRGPRRRFHRGRGARGGARIVL
mmetsp:Transcript_27377/g.84456  ORF Transcript_27377/g.84456 Transcript_27377/m.84456 type:complete len:235 (+) Transcript_27377:1687-2391(+)